MRHIEFPIFLYLSFKLSSKYFAGMAIHQRFRYFPFFIIFYAFLLCFVHFLHTKPCHCLDGYRLALNWAHAKENSSNIENEAEADEQLMLLNFLIPETKIVDEYQELIIYMAKTKCQALKSPLGGTICSGWPELWRFQSYGIVHGNISHLLSNLLGFLTYGLYFEYRHGALLTCLLIFMANFAAMPMATYGIIYGASSGCFALFGAICVDMVVILNKTWYRLAWKLKARRISCCFTLLLCLAQLLFLAFTLFYSILEFAKISGIQQSGSEQAHLAGFGTGLLFGILINCSNETRQCEQKPMVPNWFGFVCKIVLGIWLLFIVGCNLLFLHRAFSIKESVPLDADAMFEMEEDEDGNINITAIHPDLRFHLSVHFCRAYNNEKYWRDDVAPFSRNSIRHLAGQGVKRPGFCQFFSFIFASLQIILAIFAILFWEKFRMITKANVADIDADFEANAAVIGGNGKNNTSLNGAKEEQEENSAV